MNDDMHQYFHDLYQKTVQSAASRSQNGDYATVEETAELLGVDASLLNHLLEFIIHITQIQLSIAVENGHLDDEDYNEVMNSAVGNAAVSARILRKGLEDAKVRTKTEGHEYPTTLMAEAHIRKYINDKADLNKIWPMDLAEEVAGEFEPAHAFLVGVVCGSQNG